jgi:hypothetical protein
MALPTMPTPIRSMARSILTMAALATSATSTMTMGSMEALATVLQGMPASADTVAASEAAMVAEAGTVAEAAAMVGAADEPG